MWLRPWVATISPVIRSSRRLAACRMPRLTGNSAAGGAVRRIELAGLHVVGKYARLVAHLPQFGKRQHGVDLAGHLVALGFDLLGDAGADEHDLQTRRRAMPAQRPRRGHHGRNDRRQRADQVGIISLHVSRRWPGRWWKCSGARCTRASASHIAGPPGRRRRTTSTTRWKPRPRSMPTTCV